MTTDQQKLLPAIAVLGLAAWLLLGQAGPGFGTLTRTAVHAKAATGVAYAMLIIPRKSLRAETPPIIPTLPKQEAPKPEPPVVKAAETAKETPRPEKMKELPAAEYRDTVILRGAGLPSARPAPGCEGARVIQQSAPIGRPQ